MTGLILSGMLLCNSFLCYNQSILSNPIGLYYAKHRQYPMVALAPSPEPEKPKGVVEMIKYYSKEIGVNTDRALKIAGCESGYRADAKNPKSSAGGVYQQLGRYWDARAKKYGYPGVSRFDAEANIVVSLKMMKYESTSHWNESRHCRGK